MNFPLSQFGIEMSRPTGVRVIMKDLVETLQTDRSHNFINLSAGNPVILPEVKQLWRDCTAELLASSEYDEVVGRYGSSQGYKPLIDIIVEDFNRRYGLNLSSRNILITPGSQAIFFYAANAFGGYTANGDLKQIVLPLIPDYTGYGSISLVSEAVLAYKPIIERDTAAHRFKYQPNFSLIEITQGTGCVFFSRPSNPSGNVLSDDEVQKITVLAAPYNIPVFIDSAYGPPFPALNFRQMAPIFGDNVVHCLSLSKTGLPGERLGIAIGNEEIIQVLESFQNNLCIHSSRYGQALAARAIASGYLADIAIKVIRPYYQDKFMLVEVVLDRVMPKELPWLLHRGEGAIFAWLWLQDLPIADIEFCQHLKRVGVIVVPGNSFFPGLREDWPHKQQCFRISLTASNQEIELGLQLLAEVAEQVYQQGITKTSVAKTI